MTLWEWLINMWKNDTPARKEHTLWVYMWVSDVNRILPDLFSFAVSLSPLLASYVLLRRGNMTDDWQRVNIKFHRDGAVAGGADC